MNVRRSALVNQVLDPALPEGQGMALLSGEQVTRLAGALDALAVRGTLAVAVVEATRPGARVVLEVNGRRLVLPADPPRLAVVRADPTPVAMLEGGVMYALLEATDAADAAPLWSVLPGRQGSPRSASGPGARSVSGGRGRTSPWSHCRPWPR